jgi:hypothetical protein
MKFFCPPVRTAVIAAIFCVTLATAKARENIPQPKQYAALLAKARAGTLRINHGEPPAPLLHFPGFRAAPGPASEIFPPASYRAAAKTSFAAGSARTLATVPALFGPLPTDASMTQQFPALVRRTGNTSPRIDLEKRNVKIPAWIYWVAPESDHDFHIILGSTAQFGTASVFMNSEVSGLPSDRPSRSPFPASRRHSRDSCPSSGVGLLPDQAVRSP